MLLVTSWVSPSTSYVIAAVCTLVKDDPFTHVVVLPKFSGGRGYGQRTLEKSWPLSFGRKTRGNWCWLWRLVRVRTLKTKLVFFMATTSHHLEDMIANCHPPWYCRRWPARSSNTQWVSRHLWKQVRNLTGATSAVCLSLSAMLTHPGIFSFSAQPLSSPSALPKTVP